MLFILQSGEHHLIQNFMANNYYILDDANNVVWTNDVMVWAKYFETHDRRVAQTTIGNKWVSTVFLGIDHAYHSDKLQIFETMINNTDTNEWEDYQTRCATWEEAEKMHLDAVNFVQWEKQ